MAKEEKTLGADQFKTDISKASEVFDTGAISGVNALMSAIELIYQKKPNMEMHEFMIMIRAVAEIHKANLSKIKV